MAWANTFLNQYPHTTRFMREHKLMTIHSVNPATTVACTTALLTGKNPIENGWLGWSLYVDGYTDPIDVFPNTNSLTDEKIAKPDVMKEECPLTYIDALLKEKGVKARLDLQAPLWDGKGPKKSQRHPAPRQDFLRRRRAVLLWLLDQPRSYHPRERASVLGRFIHFALDQPHGEAFVKENPDVLVFTLADHGLINVQYRDIKAFPAWRAAFGSPSL
jgi:hypothetical protein